MKQILFRCFVLGLVCGCFVLQTSCLPLLGFDPLEEDKESEESASDLDSQTPSVELRDKSYPIPHSIKHFRDSKKLLNQLYSTKFIPKDFYCNCSILYETKNSGHIRGEIDPNSCGLLPRKNSKRALRLEWEHVVPAHAFGFSRSCWRENLCSKNGNSFKGRKCCTKIDPVYRAMEADLHNLQPSAGELNADRSNYSFGMIPGEPRDYGACDFEVDFSERVVEPREEIRGDIARTYFYMEKTYGVPISSQRRKLFEIWNQSDPPDAFEIQRNIEIQKIQGNLNPFIPKP